MLTCSDCERCLQAYLDQRGVVAPAEVKAHLDECRACRERFTAAKLCLDSWSNQPAPLPSIAFTRRVLAEVKRNQRRRHNLSLALRIAAGFLLLIAISAAGWITNRPRGVAPVASLGTAPKAQPAAWHQLTLASVPWKERSAEVWQRVSSEAAEQVERAAKLLPLLEDDNWLHADATLEASLVPAKALRSVVSASWQPLAQQAEAALSQLRELWEVAHTSQAIPR
jgi:hypothetical protein